MDNLVGMAVQLTVIGMGFVFFFLILLVITMTLTGKIVTSIEARNPSKSVEKVGVVNNDALTAAAIAIAAMNK